MIDRLLLWGSAPLAAALPFLGASRFSAPLVGGTCAWFFLRGRRDPQQNGATIGSLCLWALLLSASLVALTRAWPAAAADRIAGGPAYWTEMLPYVESGSGAESDPGQFMPRHLLHLCAFVVLAAVSAGWAGLVLGCYLLGYMSYYVAMVSLNADSPWLAVVLAWHPWAVLRVVAFIAWGVSLSRLWSARTELKPWWRRERVTISFAAALWLTDLALKTALAARWSGWIRRIAGISLSG